MTVYEQNNFSGRVNYAAQCIMRGFTQGRCFDTCFEMNDGDAVVTALVRRSIKNQRLREAITRYWHGTFPQSWEDVASRYGHVQKLSVEAKRQRHEGAPDGSKE